MKTTYICDTHDGPKTVTGTFYTEAPGLAIHQDYPGAPWVVTHTASGLLIARFSLRREARSFLLAVAPLLDWTQTADAIGRVIHHASILGRRLRELAYEHGRIR
jgi:hypothetical protein